MTRTLYAYRAETQADAKRIRMELRARYDPCELTHVAMVGDKTNMRDRWASLRIIPEEECYDGYLISVVEGITKENLLDAMRSVEDAHVAIQTLELAEEYDGERDYDRE
jgi:hypothetical protein